MIPRCIFISLALIVATLAQDTRTVVEPKITPTYSVVRAALSQWKGISWRRGRGQVERNEFSARSMAASRQAVELKADGATMLVSDLYHCGLELRC